MMKKWVILEKRIIGKQGSMLFVLKFSFFKYRIKTKNVISTLNRIGELFYFRPEYLLERKIINKLEMIELIGYRKRYGRIKACLLELK